MMKPRILIIIAFILCAIGVLAFERQDRKRPSATAKSIEQQNTSPTKAGATQAALNSEKFSTTAEGWREATAGYPFSFPRDHASHPPYKVEWWYYTGNLETSSGRRFGYQLTFFRTGVALQPASASRWAVRDLYMAHFCISDIEQKRFYSFEKLNRAGVGFAGAEENSYRVWNEDWQARLDGKDHLITARDDAAELELRLTPEKPEVIHGENDISQKGSTVGNASHYYSLTRLRSTGRITIGGETFEVTGLSWMDREFSSSFLEAGQVGWDWFSIQLEDGRDLMIYQFRRSDGSIDIHSSGTLIDASGRATHIPYNEFTLQPTGAMWQSDSSATYPVEWTIDLPKYNLNLKVAAAFTNQELRTTGSTNVTYWEGSVNIEGTSIGQRVKGHGYLEMTGYSGKSMSDVFQ